MSNNIVSFQAAKSPSMFSINNVSAGKNIKSVTLMEVQNLKNKDTATGYDDNINFSETGIQEYTLEELLAEGTQTQAEIQQVRAEEEARRLAEEQARILAEQQRQYEEQQRLYQQQLKELEDLYRQRDENNGLFHPIIEAEIEAKIEALEKQLNVPHQPDGWDQFVKMAENPGATAVTFVASVVEGIADVGESIVDGAVQIVGGAASYVVGAIDEDAGKAMQEGIQEFVSTDWTGKGYDAFVNAAGIDPEIAYGPAHSAGQIVGQVAGYAAISMIPGAGPAVTAVVGGLAAAGSAAESAYANGATFNEAMVVSTVAGVVGGVAGAASNQLGTVAKTSTTALDVVKYTAAGAGVGMVEPIVNSGVEYATYGNNDGKSYHEFMLESGGYKKIAMGAGSGALSTGTQATKSYKNYKNLVVSDTYKNFETDSINKRIDDHQYDAAKKSGVSKENYTMTKDEIDLATKEAISDAQDIAKRVNGLYNQGYGQKGATAEDMLELLTNGERQQTVFNQKFLNEYNAKWNPDENGNVDVVNLKPGKDYDYFVAKNGDIGRPDGEFVMPKQEADKLIKRCTKNGQLDTHLLEDELAVPRGTFDTGVVQITETVKSSDVKLPTSNLGGSYKGKWVPGGETLGGTTEGVVGHLHQKSNNNFYRDSGRKIKVVVTDLRS